MKRRKREEGGKSGTMQRNRVNRVERTLLKKTELKAVTGGGKSLPVRKWNSA